MGFNVCLSEEAFFPASAVPSVLQSTSISALMNSAKLCCALVSAVLQQSYWWLSFPSETAVCHVLMQDIFAGSKEMEFGNLSLLNLVQHMNNE